MRAAVISANLGSYDRQIEWPELRAPAGVTIDVHRFTDANLPPRPLAMTSRLQCAIPKWWAWQMVPGAQVYIWIDASCVPEPCAVVWFLERLGDQEIAVFQHPDRRTIREEYEFVKAKLAAGNRYLSSRYRGEWLEEQSSYIAADTSYVDDRLYASTAFAYRPTARVIEAFHATWAAKARWLLHDQLYFPYALNRASCDVRVMPESYLRCPALTYVRNKRRSAA